MPYLDVRRWPKATCVRAGVSRLTDDSLTSNVQLMMIHSPGCLQILSLNVVSSGAMVQQSGFSHHIGRRGNRADYTTDTMCVVFNAWLSVTSIHLKVAFI